MRKIIKRFKWIPSWVNLLIRQSKIDSSSTKTVRYIIKDLINYKIKQHEISNCLYTKKN